MLVADFFFLLSLDQAFFSASLSFRSAFSALSEAISNFFDKIFDLVVSEFKVEAYEDVELLFETSYTLLSSLATYGSALEELLVLATYLIASYLGCIS